MARVRADFVFGTTTAGIDADDTTLASASLARLPVVGSPDVAAVTLFDTATGVHEIVHVTAHSASATSATIVRGQEGSTASSWGSGSSWAVGPTVEDFDGLSRLLIEDGVTGYPVRTGPSIFFGETDPGVLMTSEDVWIQDGATADAAEIVYDNGTSGLAATDVQAAVDEVAAASGGLTTEQVQDMLSTFLVEGTDIDISYNDAGNALTITSLAAGGGGGSAETVTSSKTTSYTAAAGEFVRADATSGAFTVTLPSGTTGDKVRVKKTDSTANVVTVGGTIDGSTNMRLPDQWSTVEVIYDGSSWKVISKAGRVLPTGPTYLASQITFVNNANTINASLPAGASAGQLAVITVSHGFVPTTPTGSTLVTGGTPASHGVYYKVLLSGDITNGYITVPFGGAFYGQVGIVTVSGANASPIRNAKLQTGSAVLQLIADTSGSMPQPGDLVIYWAASRHDTGTPTSLLIYDGVQADTQINTRFCGTLNVDTLSASGWPRSVAESAGDVAEVGSATAIVVIKA